MSRIEEELTPINKWEARVIFLETIKDLVPEILTDLEKTLIPELTGLSGNPEIYKTVAEDKIALRWQDYPENIKDLLLAWSDKYNLTEKCDWIIQAAFQSILMWLKDPATNGDWAHEPITEWEGDCSENEKEVSVFTQKDNKTVATEIKAKYNCWSKTDSEIRDEEQYEWLVLKIIWDFSAEQIAEWRNKLNRPEYLGDTKSSIVKGYKNAANKVGIRQV